MEKSNDILTMKDIVKLEETITIGDIEVRVKQYIPIMDKLVFIKTIYASSIDTADNKHIINGITFDVLYKTLLVLTYTDFRLEAVGVEAYDLLTSTGVYDAIYEAIPNDEILELERVVNNYLRDREIEYNQENSVGVIVKQALASLLELIPTESGIKDIIKDAGDAFEDFDPDKLDYVDKAMKFFNVGSDGIGKGEDVQRTGSKTEGSEK